MIVVDSALLVAMCVLAFDPKRYAFVRAAGLWHDCGAQLVHGHGVERWSPMLLILLVPAAVGWVAASRLGWLAASRRQRRWTIGLRIIPLALGLVTVFLVVVPMGTCVA